MTDQPGPVTAVQLSRQELSLVMEALRTRCVYLRGLQQEPHGVSDKTWIRWRDEARRYGLLHDRLRREQES